MAVTQGSVDVQHSPDEALIACTRALVRAGFYDVETNESAMVVTGKRRMRATVRSGSISLLVTKSETGSRIEVRGQTTSLGLIGFLFDPSRRMVKKLSDALTAELQLGDHSVE
jgi:hypothetical protein